MDIEGVIVNSITFTVFMVLLGWACFKRDHFFGGLTVLFAVTAGIMVAASIRDDKYLDFMGTTFFFIGLWLLVWRYWLAAKLILHVNQKYHTIVKYSMCGFILLIHGCALFGDKKITVAINYCRAVFILIDCTVLLVALYRINKASKDFANILKRNTKMMVIHILLVLILLLAAVLSYLKISFGFLVCQLILVAILALIIARILTTLVPKQIEIEIVENSFDEKSRLDFAKFYASLGR